MDVLLDTRYDGVEDVLDVLMGNCGSHCRSLEWTLTGECESRETLELHMLVDIRTLFI